MKPYERYKDSGVEWIGEIPVGWSFCKLWLVIDSNQLGGNYKGGPEVGDYPLIKMGNIGRGNIVLEKVDYLTEEEEYDPSHLLVKDDFLFNTRNSRELVGKVTLWNEELESSVFNSNILRIKFMKKLFNKYMCYLFNTETFLDVLKLISKGTTNVSAIYYKDLSSVDTIEPPLPEQQQIVTYLDQKTSQVDELIDKKTRKIELLKEYRTSLINQVVTKGLDPNVEMKDSGVEWIGEIPVGWNTVRLKYLGDVRFSSVDKHIFKEERQVIVCNYTDVYHNERVENLGKLRKGSCSDDEFTKFELKKDDVLITKDSESPEDIGVPCYIPQQFDNVVCGYHLSIISPIDLNLSGGYLFRLFQSDLFNGQFRVSARGITRYGLSKFTIENVFVSLPPLPEQQQIVTYLDQKTQEIDTSIDTEEKKIEHLKEYRQSLISNVVTGKIDVRETFSPN